MEKEIPDYNCSHGTNGIINGLIEPSNKQHWDVFYINMITLVRNCYEKDIKYDQLITKLNNDVETIVRYLIIYSNNKYMINAVFYWPSYYTCLNKDVYRKINKNNKAVHDLYMKLFYERRLVQKDNVLFEALRTSRNNVVVADYYTNIKEIPSMSLYKYTKKNLYSRFNICLISHYEIDYHLKNFFVNTNILLSFSGRILKTNGEIASKMFKTNSVRFNKYTHYLFGDKNLIKLHLKRKEKKLLLELSEKENWAQLRDKMLYKKLLQNGLINKSFPFKIY